MDIDPILDALNKESPSLEGFSDAVLLEAFDALKAHAERGYFYSMARLTAQRPALFEKTGPVLVDRMEQYLTACDAAALNNLLKAMAKSEACINLFSAGTLRKVGRILKVQSVIDGVKFPDESFPALDRGDFVRNLTLHRNFKMLFPAPEMAALLKDISAVERALADPHLGFKDTLLAVGRHYPLGELAQPDDVSEAVKSFGPGAWDVQRSRELPNASRKRGRRRNVANTVEDDPFDTPDSWYRLQLEPFRDAVAPYPALKAAFHEGVAALPPALQLRLQEGDARAALARLAKGKDKGTEP